MGIPTKLVAVIAFYFVVSIAVVILNKVVMFVVALICAFVMAVLGRYISSLSFMPPMEYNLSRAMGVLPLTLSYLLMITMSNLCLKYVEASFYQVARSLHIMFNILLTYFILQQTTTFRIIQSCGVIFLGYVVGSWGEMNFSWLGLAYGALASLFTAANAIYVKRTLGVVNNDHWLLLYYNTINSIIILAPFMFLSGEWTQISKLKFLSEGGFWFGMTITAIFGYLINIASFLQIKYTSPLTHMISGTAKGAVQTILSVLIFGNDISLANAVGTAVVIGGSAWYSHIRYQQMQVDLSSSKNAAPSKVEVTDDIDEADIEHADKEKQ